MAKFFCMGNYTAKAFQGFIKEPNTDRSKAAKAAADAAGAKMISFDGLRGSYDFLAVFEGTFEQAAGVKMATEASGMLTNVNICESINLSDAAGHAAKIAGAYKGPGQ